METRVDQLRAQAERLLAGHILGDRSLERAMTALDEAVRLDPEDRDGETAALLGKVCFQLQDWRNAILHLTSALTKQPGNAALPELLRQAKYNGEADIGLPMMVTGYYDGVGMRVPPAMRLRAPTINRPAPFNSNAPSRISAAWGRFQEFVGTVLGLFVSGSLLVVRMSGLYRGNRDAWPQRKGLFGLLTLAAVREELNEKLRQDPYPGGQLTVQQQPAQKRPEWTKSLPTANGAWRTDDPMEGAALSRFNRSGYQPIESFTSRMSDPTLPNVLAVSRDLMHVLPGESQQLAPFLNLSYAAHIQAQAHDWMSHGENLSDEYWEVPIPDDHPARKQGPTLMTVRKTQPDPHPTPGRLTFANEVTHWWDASHVYGSDQPTSDRLRTAPDGTMLPGGELYLEGTDGKADLESGFFCVGPKS